MKVNEKETNCKEIEHTCSENDVEIWKVIERYPNYEISNS